MGDVLGASRLTATMTTERIASSRGRRRVATETAAQMLAPLELIENPDILATLSARAAARPAAA